jgi:hypothetical protein
MSNTLLLSLTETGRQGRVMSLFTLAFMGTVPIGGLCAGSIATSWGAPITLAAGGCVCVAAALSFLLKLPKLRMAPIGDLP